MTVNNPLEADQSAVYRLNWNEIIAFSGDEWFYRHWMHAGDALDCQILSSPLFGVFVV